LTASPTVLIFSASSSGMSMLNSVSNAMTSSTWSSESAPRSSVIDASGVTSDSSTPSCSTMIFLTLSNVDIYLLHYDSAVDHERLARYVGGGIRAKKAHYSADIFRFSGAPERRLFE